jgi:hypothetical protein
VPPPPLPSRSYCTEQKLNDTAISRLAKDEALRETQERAKQQLAQGKLEKVVVIQITVDAEVKQVTVVVKVVKQIKVVVTQISIMACERTRGSDGRGHMSISFDAQSAWGFDL